MKKILLMIICFPGLAYCYAGKISGTIRDTGGRPLSFSSISIKGTSKGAIANSEGQYTVSLDPGEYTLICRHVGYQLQERNITLGSEQLVIDFVLASRN